LIEKVIDSVGGSIGEAGIGTVTDGSQSVSATVALVRPAMAIRSPASTSSTPTRSSPRKASSLVARASSITSPSRLSALIGMLTRARPVRIRPVSTRPRYGSASSIVTIIENGASRSRLGGGT
jgi:predicted permease